MASCGSLARRGAPGDALASAKRRNNARGLQEATFGRLPARSGVVELLDRCESIALQTSPSQIGRSSRSYGSYHRHLV